MIHVRFQHRHIQLSKIARAQRKKDLRLKNKYSKTRNKMIQSWNSQVMKMKTKDLLLLKK